MREQALRVSTTIFCCFCCCCRRCYHFQKKLSNVLLPFSRFYRCSVYLLGIIYIDCGCYLLFSFFFRCLFFFDLFLSQFFWVLSRYTKTQIYWKNFPPALFLLNSAVLNCLLLIEQWFFSLLLILTRPIFAWNEWLACLFFLSLFIFGLICSNCVHVLLRANAV